MLKHLHQQNLSASNARKAGNLSGLLHWYCEWSAASPDMLRQVSSVPVAYLPSTQFKLRLRLLANKRNPSQLRLHAWMLYDEEGIIQGAGSQGSPSVTQAQPHIIFNLQQRATFRQLSGVGCVQGYPLLRHLWTSLAIIKCRRETDAQAHWTLHTQHHYILKILNSVSLA